MACSVATSAHPSVRVSRAFVMVPSKHRASRLIRHAWRTCKGLRWYQPEHGCRVAVRVCNAQVHASKRVRVVVRPPVLQAITTGI